MAENHSISNQFRWPTYWDSIRQMVVIDFEYSGIVSSYPHFGSLISDAQSRTCPLDNGSVSLRFRP